MRTTSRIAILACLSAGWCFAQNQDFSKVQIKVTKVAGNVYMLAGAGGNIGASVAAEGKAVSYKSGDETVNGILYTPAGKGPFPALIVIHEWWGLNDWVKQQAEKLAGQGYVALAVDLYRGKVADNPDLAHELMRGLPEDRATRDVRAAYDFLASQASVKKDRIGSIGWCMGGGYSLDTAPVSYTHLDVYKRQLLREA